MVYCASMIMNFVLGTQHHTHTLQVSWLVLVLQPICGSICIQKQHILFGSHHYINRFFLPKYLDSTCIEGLRAYYSVNKDRDQILKFAHNICGFDGVNVCGSTHMYYGCVQFLSMSGMSTSRSLNVTHMIKFTQALSPHATSSKSYH